MVYLGLECGVLHPSFGAPDMLLALLNIIKQTLPLSLRFQLPSVSWQSFRGCFVTASFLLCFGASLEAPAADHLWRQPLELGGQWSERTQRTRRPPRDISCPASHLLWSYCCYWTLNVWTLKQALLADNAPFCGGGGSKLFAQYFLCFGCFFFLLLLILSSVEKLSGCS